MGKGALAPSPENKVLLCTGSYSNTLSRRNIYALFLQPVVGSPRSYPGSIPGPRWGSFVPRPLICPFLEKFPRPPCWYAATTLYQYIDNFLITFPAWHPRCSSPPAGTNLESSMNLGKFACSQICMTLETLRNLGVVFFERAWFCHSQMYFFNKTMR